ncbi:MAG: ATPase, T2SS/T4P/T4SS family [Candidatus Heimdallarchaeaceae archaeon]
MMNKLNKRHYMHEDLILTLIDQYDIRGYSVSIYVENENSVLYHAKPDFDYSKTPFLFSQLSSLIYKNKDILGSKILTFDELIDTIKAICLWKLQQIKNLPVAPEIAAELFAFKLIRLEKLIPFFIDPNVNEIYMDQINSPIYIDHQIYGRCNTNIILSEEELSAFITRLKLEHSIIISPRNPSFKVEFITNLFHLRVSMDFPPLSPKGPNFNIRKLKKDPLTITDLIQLNTLPIFAAAYLIIAVHNRKNITIIGEPNSGKTTLSNAIDLYTPKHWRKIAIEDAIETLNKSDVGFKQLVIRVDSFESNKKDYTKSIEILKLLHRSPDWIFLGEIQSKEHTEAMFEALNAGLKGIQTTHADSVKKIFRRWKNMHKIDETNFLSLDILVIMKREIKKHKIIRKVFQIFEIDKSLEYDEQLSFLNKIYDETTSQKEMFTRIQNKSCLKAFIPDMLKTIEILNGQLNQKKYLKEPTCGISNLVDISETSVQ